MYICVWIELSSRGCRIGGKEAAFGGRTVSCGGGGMGGRCRGEAVAGGADGEHGSCGHEERSGWVVLLVAVAEGTELLELKVEAPVLLGERLAAAVQQLAVHLCLLQLRPAIN